MKKVVLATVLAGTIGGFLGGPVALAEEAKSDVNATVIGGNPIKEATINYISDIDFGTITSSTTAQKIEALPDPNNAAPGKYSAFQVVNPDNTSWRAEVKEDKILVSGGEVSLTPKNGVITPDGLVLSGKITLNSQYQSFAVYTPGNSVITNAAINMQPVLSVPGNLSNGSYSSTLTWLLTNSI